MGIILNIIGKFLSTAQKHIIGEKLSKIGRGLSTAAQKTNPQNLVTVHSYACNGSLWQIFKI